MDRENPRYGRGSRRRDRQKRADEQKCPQTGCSQLRKDSIRVRARPWSAWRPAAPEAEDGPDHPAEAGWRIGNPYWTGDADAIAYRLRGRVTRLRAYYVESPVDDLPPRRLSIVGSPPIIARPSWSANE